MVFFNWLFFLVISSYDEVFYVYIVCYYASMSDNMLKIIDAHPNWPVYADVFEHPPPRLAS